MQRISFSFDGFQRHMNYPFQLSAMGYIAANYYLPTERTEKHLVVSFLLNSESQNAFAIIDGRRYALSFPSVYIVNRAVSHEIHADRPWEEIYFAFLPESVEGMKRSGLRLENGNEPIQPVRELEKSKNEILDLLPHIHAAGMLDRLDMLAYRMIAEALLPAQDLPFQGMENTALAKIAAYLYRNYTKKFDLDSLLKRYGMSRRTFYREWNKHFPVSPAHFIMEMKLGFAKELLRNSTLTLTEISGNVGFSSSVELCRNFLKHTAMTPGAYRASCDSR